jgi:hypothetical protein
MREAKQTVIDAQNLLAELLGWIII